MNVGMSFPLLANRRHKGKHFPSPRGNLMFVFSNYRAGKIFLPVKARNRRRRGLQKAAAIGEFLRQEKIP